MLCRGFFLLSFLVLIVVVHANASEQITVGNSCTTGQNASDWDTIMQCSSGTWQRSALFFGTDSETCTATLVGKMRYNSTSATMEYCNGASWTPLMTAAASPVTATNSKQGYFVLTKSSFQGNFGTTPGDTGGFNGANAVCLNELTTNHGWKGYSTASANGQLVKGKVFAFICPLNLCTMPLPYTIYAFANGNDSTAGPSTACSCSGPGSCSSGCFETDALGQGPNDSANWSGQSYFNTSATYWTGDRGSYSTYFVNGFASSGLACNSSLPFDSNSNSYNGQTGTSNATNNVRLGGGGSKSCDNSYPILCFVNP